VQTQSSFNSSTLRNYSGIFFPFFSSLSLFPSSSLSLSISLFAVYVRQQNDGFEKIGSCIRHFWMRVATLTIALRKRPKATGAARFESDAHARTYARTLARTQHPAAFRLTRASLCIP